MRPEIWPESTWCPAFAKTVQGYQARIYSTQAPDECQSSMFSCLIGIIAVDLRKGLLESLLMGLTWMMFRWSNAVTSLKPILSPFRVRTKGSAAHFLLVCSKNLVPNGWHVYAVVACKAMWPVL